MAATTAAIRPLSSVLLGLGDDNLSLNARQQNLGIGQRQAQIRDSAETARPINPHDIRAPLIPLGIYLHQPHNPSHAPTS